MGRMSPRQQPRFVGKPARPRRHGNDMFAGQHHSFAARQLAVEHIAKYTSAVTETVFLDAIQLRPDFPWHGGTSKDLRVSVFHRRAGGSAVVLEYLDVCQPWVGPQGLEPIAVNGENVTNLV